MCRFSQRGGRSGKNAEIEVKLEFIVPLLRTIDYVILSGVRSTESKNLRIMTTFAVKSVPRSFDSLTLAQDDMLRQLLDKL